MTPLLEPEPSPTEAAHATALQMLERHGVATREGVRAEGVAGGFAAVYPVLRALEEAGRARRGWFVAGLGAAQFAMPGAVDRLRAHRHVDDDEPARVLLLAATDPAQPYGAALAWPEHSSRPARAAGRVRGAGRWCVRGICGAGRQEPAHVHRGRQRGRRRPRRPLARSARGSAQGRTPAPAHDRAHRRRACPHLAVTPARCARPASPTATRA